MRDLDMNADQVRALLDEGKLVGFNIATNETGKKNLRLLTMSIHHYCETGKYLAMEWPEIFHLVLPHDRLFVRGMEIQRSLNCDQGHVQNLIKTEHLQCVKKSQRGPGGSPMVTRGSLEAFLKGRML